MKRTHDRHDVDRKVRGSAGLIKKLKCLCSSFVLILYWLKNHFLLFIDSGGEEFVDSINPQSV